MLDYDTPATVSQHFYNGIMIRAHIHSENGQLKAEKYTNDQVAKTYIALQSLNEIHCLKDKIKQTRTL